MKAFIRICALALSPGIVAQAVTTSTTLTVNATATVSASAVTASGTATLTNIGSGTFSGTLPFTGISGLNVVGSYTIALSGGTITGALTLPVTLFSSLLSGTAASGAGSISVTGGTGSYANATGSFPNVSGNGTSSASGVIGVTLSGDGSITTAAAPPPNTTPHHHGRAG